MVKGFLRLALGIAGGLVAAAGHAQSFDVDDCVLKGLKGVASDAAARMVREACNNKAMAASRQGDQRLVAEYGEEDQIATLTPVTNVVSIEGGGYVSRPYRYETKDSSKMITYIRLLIRDVDKTGHCDILSVRSYAYKTTIKPNTTATFFVKSSAESVCIDVVAVRTKPYKWTEFSLSSDVKPMDKDPFAPRPVVAAAPTPAAAPAPVYYPPSRR